MVDHLKRYGSAYIGGILGTLNALFIARYFFIGGFEAYEFFNSTKTEIKLIDVNKDDIQDIVAGAKTTELKYDVLLGTGTGYLSVEEFYTKLLVEKLENVKHPIPREQIIRKYTREKERIEETIKEIYRNH